MRKRRRRNLRHRCRCRKCWQRGRGTVLLVSVSPKETYRKFFANSSTWEPSSSHTTSHFRSGIYLITVPCFISTRALFPFGCITRGPPPRVTRACAQNAAPLPPPLIVTPPPIATLPPIATPPPVVVPRLSGRKSLVILNCRVSKATGPLVMQPNGKRARMEIKYSTVIRYIPDRKWLVVWDGAGSQIEEFAKSL